MVLQKQIIPIPFVGLQTKVDPKTAPLGSYEELDNVIMNRYPELVKRDGLSPIGSATTLSDINAMYSHINETGVITTQSLYAYSPTYGSFIDKGYSSSPIIRPYPVIANTYSQTDPDSAVTSSGYQMSSWTDSRGGIRCSIQDIASDTDILTDYSITSSGQISKVVAGTNSFVLFYITSTNLMAIQYNMSSLTFSDPVIVTDNIATTFAYDVIPSSNNVLVVYLTMDSTIVGAYWSFNDKTIITNASPLPNATVLDITNADSGMHSLTVCSDSSGADTTYFVVTYQNSLNYVYTRSFTPRFVALSSELEVASATSDEGFNITTCVDYSHNTYIFYTTTDVGTNYTTYYAEISSNISDTPVVESNALFYTRLCVASRAFFFSGNPHVVLSYDSPTKLQNTYFGVRNDGTCWGRMFAEYGGGANYSANHISSVYANPNKSNTYRFVFARLTQLSSNSQGITAQYCVYTEQVYFTPSNIDNGTIGNVLNIAGGFLKNYDGAYTVFEQGFHLYPEKPTCVEADIGTGNIPNGTYSYVVVWEWEDRLGNLYRSSVSVPTTVVIADGPANITLTVPCLPITNKEERFSNKRSNPVCAVYRTKSLGTTYYRINQTTSSFVYNDPLSATITVTDNYTDTDIASNTLLYTTGGVFENIVLPSTNLLCIAQNRVVVAGSDVFPNQVFYSKEIQLGIAVEFSAEQSFFVQSTGGDITAIAAMDDKILIFKETLIYYVSGSLLDNTGSNGAAPYPYLVSSVCGCNYPQSIVLTQLGIMFQSAKGIYLVDRTLNVSYIGQAIDKYTTNVTPPLQITSAANLTNQNIVVFTDQNNQSFVYDTVFQQWYTQSYTFSPIASSVLSDEWYVCSNDQVFLQVQGQSYDNVSTPVITTIKTNWISFAGIDGFCRIYAIMVYGSGAANTGTLNAKVYYDFEEYFTEIVSIIPYNQSYATTWGSDTTWGAGTPWGSDFDGTYNFMIRPGRQKCSAIKIEIYDSFPTGNTSESFSYSGMTMAVGVKPTWNKSLAYTRRLT